MVTIIYLLILVPIILYITASIFEMSLSIGRIFHVSKKSQLYAQATTEITNTFLVYGFTIFVVTHADILPAIAVDLFTPVAIFITALLLRGCLYLFLFYSDNPHETPRRFWHGIFALTYITNLATLVWMAVIASSYILQNHFAPSTDNVEVIAIGALLMIAVCAFPVFSIYKNATKR